ncbi:hypothetical protein BXZ70DRAFT_321330 [Cristinia sonorae]|uniref:Uncharacterized protein n=1 Tax=Cristinia sonorae TaxID=1940300 RepID=A0A8K0XND3_9AGAR|nr:hypothetical protein BXZ70DRAFT_321330 [Cristinia sonorae]
MVDWRSHEVETACLDAYVRIDAFVLGVYLYWYCLTLNAIEMPLFLRNLKFSYTHIPYVLGRAGGVAGAIIMITLSTEDYGSYCERLRPVMPVVAAIVVTCSSTNIAIRPLTLFRRNYYILGVLGVALITHWLMATTAPTGKCVAALSASENHSNMIILFYTYTILWDLLILGFTIYGLATCLPAQTSPLWRRLYSQGVVYVIATALLNIPMLPQELPSALWYLLLLLFH